MPTLKEQGFDTATRQPIIWAGPAGMPREIRERLRGALMAAANDPEVQARQTAASIAIRVLDDVATRSLIAEMRPGVEGALTAAGMSRRG